MSQVELKARWALLGRTFGLKVISNRGDRILLEGEISAWAQLKVELLRLRGDPNLTPHEKGSLTSALRRVESALGRPKRAGGTRKL